MPPNYQVEASGTLFWKSYTRSVSFDSKSYTIEFRELKPENYEEKLLEVLNDHTAKLKVKDPNGLV